MSDMAGDPNNSLILPLLKQSVSGDNIPKLRFFFFKPYKSASISYKVLISSQFLKVPAFGSKSLSVISNGLMIIKMPYCEMFLQ